jgi:hypothetical protein
MALLRPLRSVTPATRRHRGRFAGTASVRSSQCSLKGRRRPLGGVLLLEGLVGSSGFRRAWGLLGQRGRSRPPVRTFRSYAITQLGHALLFGAMGATEDTAIRLYAVADDPASAMSARWCESLDGAFEAVEDVCRSSGSHLERAPPPIRGYGPTVSASRLGTPRTVLARHPQVGQVFHAPGADDRSRCDGKKARQQPKERHHHR